MKEENFLNDRNGATQTHFRNGKKPVKPLPRPAFRRQCVGKGINSFIIILFSMMIISQSRHFTFCFPEQVEKGGKKEKENNLVGVKPKTEDLFPFFGWSNMSPTWTKLFHHLMMKIASKLRDSFLSSYRIVGKTKHLRLKKKLLQHTFVACFSRKIINPPPSKGRASCIIYI